jgi:hypothetical protein
MAGKNISWADGNAIFLKGKECAFLINVDVQTKDIPMAQLCGGTEKV